MEERDVEKQVSRDVFISTLKRAIEALESGESFRIQVMGQRFTVPTHASLSIEHEVEGDEVELEFQFRWSEPHEN